MNKMRISNLLAGLVLVAVLTTAAVSPVLADCQPDGTDGDDTIACNGSDADGVDAGAGVDIVTVFTGADVTADVEGGDGSDTITVNASGRATDIVGDNANTNDVINGDDTVTVTETGVVQGDIDTGGGEDTVEIAGQVDGDVKTGDGNDTVRLTGTQVGGTIDGGETGETLPLALNCVAPVAGDTIEFNMQSNDNDEVNAAKQAIAAADATPSKDGQFNWQGGVIQWVNFETLVDAINAAVANGLHAVVAVNGVAVAVNGVAANGVAVVDGNDDHITVSGTVNNVYGAD